MASIPRPSSSGGVASMTLAQADLKADDQSRPRAPTPFQEAPKLSHEDSAVNDPEQVQGALAPSGTVKPGSQTDVPQCEDGDHEYKTKHGVMGIIMAVALFPCGLICFFRDKKTVCVKCGAIA